MEAHLLGRIDWSDCAELQRRIVADLALRDDGQIRLLLCEHPDTITIGRRGSEADARRNSTLARSGQVPILWVKRGGGAMLHTAGQLQVCLLVPLAWHGLTLGDYLRRFQQAILATLQELGIPAHPCRTAFQSGPPNPQEDRHSCLSGGGVDVASAAAIEATSSPDRQECLSSARNTSFAIDGRTGRLVTFGIAVQRGVTLHGAAINVCPRMGLFHLVAPAAGAPRMSCLSAERGVPVGMAPVRAELVRQLADAFGCQRYHLYFGHPLLRRVVVRNPAAAAE
jgi:lipoyl(octanoyl) transferase